jgi:hypothetical protein
MKRLLPIRNAVHKEIRKGGSKEWMKQGRERG